MCSEKAPRIHQHHFTTVHEEFRNLFLSLPLKKHQKGGGQDIVKEALKMQIQGCNVLSMS